MLEHATSQSKEISIQPQSHFGVSWMQVVPHIIHLELVLFGLVFFSGEKNRQKLFWVNSARE